jgi:methyltransferase (TIGR00027 family)
MPETLVSNVSDTARWVAVYRAWESARPDALFSDPYAARLAGEHGTAIASKVPRRARSGWPMIVRTKVMDDLILASIADGCDRVLNLAAGFDTRPYRLRLPDALPWIEADLPAMIDEKEKLLADAKPVCRLSREKVDLAEDAQRSQFLVRALSGARQVLVVTEGLLGYLDDHQVSQLARDLAARPAIRWWILDQASPAILKMMQRGMGNHLSNAPLKFGPAEGVALFEALSWQPLDIHSVLHEAARLRRLPFLFRLFARLPGPNPRRLGKARWSGIVRYERR